MKETEENEGKSKNVNSEADASIESTDNTVSEIAADSTAKLDDATSEVKSEVDKQKDAETEKKEDEAATAAAEAAVAAGIGVVPKAPTKPDSKAKAKKPKLPLLYKIVMGTGIFVALVIACMPWIGTTGMADPKTAEGNGLWINFLGRYHPVILHLPIGSLFLVVCLEGIGLLSLGRYKAKTTIALAFAAGTAVLASVLGYFWYLTGDFNSELAQDHKRDGVIFTVLMIATFLVKFSADKKISKWFKVGYYPLLLLTVVLMVVASHHGGKMVHGDPMRQHPDKVLERREAKEKNNQEQSPENGSSYNGASAGDIEIYAGLVHPIIEDKCVSCHGEDKVKGDLRMDSIAAMLEGGSDEECLVPGDVGASYMLTSLDLPIDDDYHMPPKEDPQVTDAEKAVLTWWVKIGAPEKKKLSEFEVPSDVAEAITVVQAAAQ